MRAKDVIVAILESHYGNARILEYCESDDEIRLKLPTPIIDQQAAAFRSQATIFNDLAISHRLSLVVGRSKYGLLDDSAFAIKSIETAAHSIDPVDGYDLSLRFDAFARRHDTITALRSTLVTKCDVEARITITSFNVLPPSLANFVRRSRKFMDFRDVKMSRDTSCLSTVADNHFRYYPSEEDRLSDGRRVDHVPALALIDIAILVGKVIHPGAARSSISAEFLNYTDPRLEFDIVLKKDHGTVEFVQNGQPVAIVHNRDCPASIARG
jgi:hypothetical protein